MQSCMLNKLTFVVLLLISTLAHAGGGQQLTISDASILGISETSLDITMDSTAPTEGFVLAIGVDDSLLSISDIAAAGSTLSASAELVVPEVFSNGATLGVVLDAQSPFDGQTIGAGSGQLIATMSVAALIVADEDTDTQVTFLDGSLNSPTLDNILVQGGLSLGATDGLGLNSGTVTLEEAPPATMYSMDASAPADGNGTTGDAHITIDNSLGAVQGYVTAVTHDSTVITLESISLGATATDNSAEFEISNIYENGGTLGVVMDFNSPFDGQTIPLGTGLHIATYTYSCNDENIYVLGEPEPAAATSELTLDSGTLGSPPLDNVLVIGGLSLPPLLSSGTFTCEPIGVPAEDTILWMETEFDTDEGNYAYLGQTGDLCFYYKDDDDYIQGFTLTVCYDCDLTIHEDSWEFNGSILDQVGIEYLAVQVDDDCSDGETGELIVALLLDALPPFEGQTLPQTTDLNEGRLLVGTMRVTVDMTAECNEDQLIYWCNGIDGNGDVSLYNNVVIDFESVQIYERNDTLVHVVPEEVFQRGDCNSDDKVDLADSATMLANQFNGLPILCPDACDSNDDGTLNMADSVYLLNWLFKFGPIPTAPGPYEDGPDATPDDTLPVCDSDDTNC